MKKIISFIGVLLVGVLCLTGCGKDYKGNCKATECINKIDVNNTVEEINSIIGFEGELINSNYNQYSWQISDTTSITAKYYSGTTATITLEVEKEELKNSKVDLSKYDSEIKPLLDSSSLTYDEFVSKMGGVEGTLVEKSSLTKKYIWVDSDLGYLNASFSISTGKCTFVSGRY